MPTDIAPVVYYDVVVIGSGIAGCTAAVRAAQTGAQVALACCGPLFSGSSFYRGTWGLGLIGPTDEADEKDLEHTIRSVGCGVVNHKLVHRFVHAINPTLDWLEHDCHTSVRRASAAAAQQRDYLPCFDHKHRNWQGLEHEALIQSFSKLFDQLHITTLPYHSLLDLIEVQNHITGALLYDQASHKPVVIHAPSVLLATGGFGGLFNPTLTQPEVLSSAHAIALNHGCSLVNAEFIQLMPTIVSPIRGAIFNEKIFKYARVYSKEGRALVHATPTCLDARSEHGPFSSRLANAALDLEIAAQPSGTVKVQYDLPEQIPEFMKTYFDWLAAAAAVTPQDTLEIALWPHASNGGLYIDENGSCIGGPAGLYAAGESCGGMHGADRLGGLSSANALVFGHIAGSNAGLYAQNNKHTGRSSAVYINAIRACQNAYTQFTEGTACARAQEFIDSIREHMQQSCVLNRSEETLAATAQKLAWLQETANSKSCSYAELSDYEQARLSPQKWNDRRALSALQQNLLLEAQALVAAMRIRTESRGSHYRTDFPQQSKDHDIMYRVFLDKDGLPRAAPLNEGASHVR